MNVLIVEDNRLNQQVAIHSLKKCGVSIDVAENGLIAVQKIEETIKGTLKPYDIIFMDILMPVMDGNEATRKIRELERKASNNYKRNLIVALSANVGPEHTLSVKEAGCDGSLGKPFYPSTLRQLVYAVHSGEYQGFESKDPQAAIRPGH
jgi:CheY-like chemotaxis protein